MKAALQARTDFTQNAVRQVSSRCVLHHWSAKRVGSRRGVLQARAQAEMEPTKQTPTELEGASTNLEVIYERLVKVCVLYVQ
jgi:hypothetical protein